MIPNDTSAGRARLFFYRNNGSTHPGLAPRAAQPLDAIPFTSFEKYVRPIPPRDQPSQTGRRRNFSAPPHARCKKSTVGLGAGAGFPPVGAS